MKIIGHRGARGLAPENTVASLKKGIEHQVDMIEFDVRVSADGIPVLHHDPIINLNVQSLDIDHSTYADLKDLKSDLATLPEVLALKTDVPFYIEVKPKVPVAPIVKAINKARRKNIFLASKSQKTLRELHEALPDIPKIVIEPWSGVRGHMRARQVSATIIAMNQHWLWWGFILGFKNNKVQLYAYTLNNPKKAKRWAQWGLSGAITDYPDRFQS